jgi:hypothetical protein
MLRRESPGVPSKDRTWSSVFFTGRVAGPRLVAQVLGKSVAEEFSILANFIRHTSASQTRLPLQKPLPHLGEQSTPWIFG